MKEFRELAKAINQIYIDSHNTFTSYQRSTGLNCLSGCGACCLSKEISATVLEMIPTALDLYDRGIAQEVYDQLLIREDLTCYFYHKLSPDGFKGLCMNYGHRPSVCRSFGAAAARNKYGQKTMSICKLIKEQQGELINSINPELAPVIGEFARKVMSLDPRLGERILPINQALKEALEMILHRSEYEKESG